MRQALQMALDALTCCEDHPHWCTHCDDYVDRNGEVVQAIREALKQEPVAWRYLFDLSSTYTLWNKKPDTEICVPEPLYRGD